MELLHVMGKLYKFLQTLSKCFRASIKFNKALLDQFVIIEILGQGVFTKFSFSSLLHSADGTGAMPPAMPSCPTRGRRPVAPLEVEHATTHLLPSPHPFLLSVPPRLDLFPHRALAIAAVLAELDAADWSCPEQIEAAREVRRISCFLFPGGIGPRSPESTCASSSSSTSDAPPPANFPAYSTTPPSSKPHNRPG